MTENLVKRPAVLGGLFVLSAFLGAGVFAGVQALAGGGPAASQRAGIEQVVRAYLLEHPEVLPEAMDRLQARELAKRDSEASKQARLLGANLTRPYSGAATGNPDGDVTVVAFMDYACGYCRASLPILDRLVQQDKNLRIVYREFPILGDMRDPRNPSTVAAQWALAAAEQGKYKAFHDRAFSGQLSLPAIEAAAKGAELDLAAAQGAAASKRVAEELSLNHQMAQKLGATGTPMFVIGDKVFPGIVPYEDLAKAVAVARAAR